MESQSLQISPEVKSNLQQIADEISGTPVSETKDQTDESLHEPAVETKLPCFPLDVPIPPRVREPSREALGNIVYEQGMKDVHSGKLVRGHTTTVKPTSVSAPICNKLHAYFDRLHDYFDNLHGYCK